MTAFAAWIGVDQRGPASVYFASDSRISWGPSKTWDCGRKLFVSQSGPHLLGYIGDVMFPSLALAQVMSAIDVGAIFDASASPRQRFSLIQLAIRSAFDKLPVPQRRAFTIVYATRQLEKMLATFLFGISLDPELSSSSTIRWRNTAFERCDVAGALLPEAKKHHIPKGLGRSSPLKKFWGGNPMQLQPLTWKALILQFVLSLGPAAITLAATYFTLRHQRRLQSVEHKSATVLRARELMFGMYQKRLDAYVEHLASLGGTWGWSERKIC
jgi:hypothetical protein